MHTSRQKHSNTYMYVGALLIYMYNHVSAPNTAKRRASDGGGEGKRLTICLLLLACPVIFLQWLSYIQENQDIRKQNKVLPTDQVSLTA